jgi:hypothetical protein
MKVLPGAIAIIGFTAALGAQDPVKTLPDAYSLQFENEWVRVVRVTYPPLATLPAHEHNALAAAYVYLTDGGPVVFRHIDAPYGPATRPATKAGGFRVFRGVKEIHEVENTSALPSEFLRVEFKTDPRNDSTLKGRFFRDPSLTNDQRVQFENDQVRITRLLYASGQSFQVETGATQPALLVALTVGRLRAPGDAAIALALGEARWLEAGDRQVFENIGTDSVELLRFDFKTAPLTSESQPAGGSHPSE